MTNHDNFRMCKIDELIKEAQDSYFKNLKSSPRPTIPPPLDILVWGYIEDPILFTKLSYKPDYIGGSVNFNPGYCRIGGDPIVKLVEKFEKTLQDGTKTILARGNGHNLTTEQLNNPWNVLEIGYDNRILKIAVLSKSPELFINIVTLFNNVRILDQMNSNRGISLQFHTDGIHLIET